METNMFQKIKTLVHAGVLGVIALGSSNSFANGGNDHNGGNDDIEVYGVEFEGLRTLTGPSLPAFGTRISASFTKGSSSSVLKVKEADSKSTFRVPFSPYSYGIKDTKYNLTANFNSSGAFTSGSVAIDGKFNGSSTSTTLMTANLTSFAKSSDGEMWGFNTNNIVCSAAINAAAHGCTTAEVVYLGLADAQKSLTKSWSTKGVALTSVPVPTAAWLLGSGLVGLVGVARRKR